MSTDLICEWFDLCEKPAVGMAAHGVRGVIPVCREHAAGITLITRLEESA